MGFQRQRQCHQKSDEEDHQNMHSTAIEGVDERKTEIANPIEEFTFWAQQRKKKVGKK